MRIGISGAQSVGKTTLLNALRSEKVFGDYAICNEVTRRVQSYGLTINEGGNDTTQRLIMQEHIVNLFMHNNMITDRTSLDGLVYTKYLHTQKQVSESTLEFAREVFLRTIGSYDLMFYIPPEFDIEDDGTRSIDKSFRDSIVRQFEHTIKTDDIQVIYLTGSVRERTQKVLDEYNRKAFHDRFPNRT